MLSHSIYDFNYYWVHFTYILRKIDLLMILAVYTVGQMKMSLIQRNFPNIVTKLGMRGLLVAIKDPKTENACGTSHSKY